MSSLPPKPEHEHAMRDIDDKYHEARIAALKHIERTKNRRKAEKPSPTILSPPTEDFILFPNDERKQKRPQSNGSARRCGKPDSPKRSGIEGNSAAATASTLQSPRRRDRTPRHGGFKVVDLSKEHDDDDDNERRREGRPPPAPSPPKLDSPDISDAEEDLWCSCSQRQTDTKRRGAA